MISIVLQWLGALAALRQDGALNDLELTHPRAFTNPPSQPGDRDMHNVDVCCSILGYHVPELALQLFSL